MSKYLKKILIVAVAVCCALSVQLSVSALPSMGDLGALSGVQDFINSLFPSTQSTFPAKTTIVTDGYFVTDVNRKLGDVNNDGAITASDARLILRTAAGIDVLSGTASDSADVNGDSVITAKDARSVLRYAAGITTSF